MPTLRTVLFDLDGTLIDSLRLILDSYHHTLAQHGLPARTDEDWLKGVGTPLTAQLSEWRDKLGTVEAMIATYREYNLKHHDRMVTIYPGVVDAIREIKAAGLETGLVTSKNRQGALSVTQIEIMPQPPERENKALTWPDWPMKLRTSSSTPSSCNINTIAGTSDSPTIKGARFG